MTGLLQIARIAASLALCLACLQPSQSLAQTAMGDDPCGAPIATPGSNCVPNGPANNFTSPVGYTDFLGGAPCSGIEKTVDAWIQFTANSVQTSIYWTELLPNNSVLYLYEQTAPGACPGTQPTLNQVACVNAAGGGTGMVENLFASTTIGTTYYLRIKSIVDANPSDQSGYLCIVGCQLAVFPQVVQHASCMDSCDGAASVTPTGGLQPFTYQWDAAANSSTDSLVTGLCDGLYNATLTDSAGCNLNVGIIINEPAAFTGTLDSTKVTCHGNADGGASVSSNGGTTPYTYLWSTGGTTSNINMVPAGMYTVTVADAGSCGFIDSIEVIQPAPIEYRTRVFEPSCNGFADGEIRLDSIHGETPFSFKLDTGFMSAFILDSTFTGLTAGTYSIIVRDVNLCIDSLWVTIGEPDVLQALPIITPNSCDGVCDGTVGINPSGGTSPYSYQWLTGETTQIVGNVCPGVFDVQVTDDNGCLAGFLFNFIGPPPVVATEVHTNTTCYQGSDGSITLSVMGGAYPYTYNWTNTFQYDSTLTNLAANTYDVTVSDSEGCTDTLSIEVTQPDTFIVTAEALPDTLCIGETGGFKATAVGGNMAPYTFFWNNGVVDSTFFQTFDATISFNVYAVDPMGCTSAPTSAQVFVHPELTAAAVVGDDFICEGTETSLFAAGVGGNGGPYTITFDNRTFVVDQDTTAMVNPNSYPNPTTYDVTVDDGCSPPDVTQVTINYLPSPMMSVTSNIVSGCNPVTIQISHASTPVDPLVFYDFGDGETAALTQNTIFHTYFEPGEYTPTVTAVHSGNGCAKTEPLPYPLVSHPIPTADFTADPQPTTLIDTEVQFTDRSVGDIFLWQYSFFDLFDETAIPPVPAPLLGQSFLPSPTYKFPDVAGDYEVRLIVQTNANCRDTVFKSIRIDEDFTFWAPNAFTPNADLRNDVFRPVGIGWNEDRYTFMIFTRQGELVYQTNTVGDVWDGLRRDNGEPAATGVYVWKVIVEDISATGDNEKVFTGTVTLLR